MIHSNKESGFGAYGKTATAKGLLPVQDAFLDIVEHMAYYGEMLVVITGPMGSGKTTLANALIARREEPEEGILITADMMLGMPALIKRIAAQLNISVPDALLEAREALREEVQRRVIQGKSFLVVIDQAELLDAATLNDIAHFSLVFPQGISVILLGLTGFETQLRDCPVQAQVNVQPIPPFSETDAQMLVQQIYSPNQALPISMQEFTQMYRKSGGWVGALLNLASDHFITDDGSSKLGDDLATEPAPVESTVAPSFNSASGFAAVADDADVSVPALAAAQYQKASVAPAPEVTTEVEEPSFSAAEIDDDERYEKPLPKKDNGRFPIPHILALSALLMVMLLVFFYQSDKNTDADTEVAVESVDVLRGVLPEREESTVTVSDFDEMLADSESEAEVELDANGLPILTETSPEAAEMDFEPEVPAEAVQPQAPVAVVPATPAAPMVATVEPTSSKPAAPMDTTATPTSAKPAVAPAKPVVPPAAPKTDRERLLAAKQGYVVQLFGGYEKDNADKFAKTWGPQIRSSLYQYETTHKNKRWFVVVVGIYPTHAEAAAAVRSFPSKLRSETPWIREVRAVQQGLR